MKNISSMNISGKFPVYGLLTLCLCLIPSHTSTLVIPLTKVSDQRAVSHLNNAPLVASRQSANNPEDTLAALTVYLEARGESFAGKLAVAAVIRNRMKFKYSSDGTVKGTVLRPKQFQPWNRMRPHQIQFDLDKSSMRESLLAWRLVQDGRNVVSGAVLFYNPRLVPITPYWAMKSQKVASIGGHEFFVPPKNEI